MNKQELQRLIKIEDRIQQIITNDLGLKVCPIEWDIVPAQKMLEIMAYNLPTNISNWKFGRDYERLRTIYDNLDPNLPYEVVIHDNPARAYLMGSNVFAVQVLVMAHVYGHVNFFTENKWFQNSRQDIVALMGGACERFNEYERIYGIDAVEQIVDAGHALQWHSSPFETETEDVRRQRVYEQKKMINAPDVSEFNDLVQRATPANSIANYNTELWKSLKLKTPVEPVEDILRYTIDNSRILEDWQKDVLEIVRTNGQYYWPIMKTRYMNEGYACITGKSLVHTENGFVPIIQASEYCSKVVGINNNLTDIKSRIATEEIATVKIKTNTGLCLEGAELHKILCENDVDVCLKNLKLGDKVKMSVGANIWPEGKIKIDIDKCRAHLCFSRSKDVDIPEYFDSDFAYLIGFFIAEGSFIGRGIEITNTNLSILMELCKIIKTLFNYDVEPRKRNYDNIWDIKINSTAIIDLFEQLGVIRGKSGVKLIPWSVLQSPKPVVSSFIAGFFDGDGCIYWNGAGVRSAIFTSKSYDLINQFATVLLNYGIVCSCSISKKNGYDDCYQLKILNSKSLRLFDENVKLKDINKCKLLKDCLENVKWSFDVKTVCEVVEITKGFAVNYDWYIPEGNHYVAQGFINHNTLIHEHVLDKLFNEGLLSGAEHGQFNYSNSLVKAKSSFSMNPYHIGSEIWKDVKMRWDKGQHGQEWKECENIIEKEEWDTKEMGGWEKVKNVMRTYTDWFFLQDFLTNEMVEKMGLYVYVQQQTSPATVDAIITDFNSDEVRRMIVNSFANSGIPKIDVIDGNYNNDGSLLLEHKFSGLPLDKGYCIATMKHINQIWGRPVYINTRTMRGKNIQYRVPLKDGQQISDPISVGNSAIGASPLQHNYTLNMDCIK